jgi:hypothetical protein
MMEFVNGKDDIPYIMESHKSHVPNHQPATNVVNPTKKSGSDQRWEFVFLGLLTKETKAILSEYRL